MATNNDIIKKLESELQELKEARVSEDGGWFPKYGDIFIYVRSFLISFHSFKGNKRKWIVSYVHWKSIYGEGFNGTKSKRANHSHMPQPRPVKLNFSLYLGDDPTI